MFPAEEMPRSKMWFGALATQCPVPRPGDTSRHVLPPGPSPCSPAPSGQTSLEEAPVSRTERQGTSFFCSFWFPSSSYSWMGLQCVRTCACVCTCVCVVHFCFIISMLVMTDFFQARPSVTFLFTQLGPHPRLSPSPHAQRLPKTSQRECELSSALSTPTERRPPPASIFDDKLRALGSV